MRLGISLRRLWQFRRAVEPKPVTTYEPIIWENEQSFREIEAILDQSPDQIRYLRPSAIARRAQIENMMGRGTRGARR